MTPELLATIEDSYRVFSSYTIGSALVVCRCPSCMSKEIERTLVKTPLRTIPARLLAEYTNSAHEWDDSQVAREFRHFLPRYFELIAHNNPPDTLGIDICLRRLAPSRWREKWPAAEVLAIERFFDELMRASLLRLGTTVWPAGRRLSFNIGSILTLIVTAEGDLDRTLAVWKEAPNPGAGVHLAAMRFHIVTKRGRTYFDTAHLENFPEPAERIAEFVLRPAAADLIEDAFFKTNDPDLQKFLSDMS